MKNKYIHDAENEAVYCFPICPEFLEQFDKKRKRTGGSVRMKIDITRADNRLIGNQWAHPVASFPKQSFDERYSPKQVISYFHMHHDPHGDEISEDAYIVLKQKYEAKARRSNSHET